MGLKVIRCIKQGQVAGCCEHGNVASGSIEGREFLCKLGDYQLLNKDPAVWTYTS
jgi:hypothetical protein